MDSDLSRILGPMWPELLQRVSDPLMVLGSDRTIRFLNERARRLLGYGPGDVLGGRCRKTTRGVDCEDSCPLSFALDHGLDLVEDFSTVYRSKEGRPVPLRVTVLPLRDASGGFAGAVEILQPADPDPGFFLSGRSEAAASIRRRVSELAVAHDHVAVIGGPVECADVARAIHRFAGLEEGLFHVLGDPAEKLPQWPPPHATSTWRAASRRCSRTSPTGGG